MIKSTKPLTLAEVKDILGKKQDIEKAKEVLAYTQKFTKLNAEKSMKMKQELEGLGLLKVKEEQIAKIIDLMPADQDDVRKIFEDVSLDENEIAKILEVTKKYS